MDKIGDIFIKYKFLILPVICGLSSMVILIFVVIPQLSMYFQNRQKIADLLKQTSILEAKAKELDNIDLVQTQQNLHIVLTVLPKDPDPPSAIDLLQAKVKTSGLVLKGVSFSKGVGDSSNKGSYQINLSVLGSLDLVRQFLISLQTVPLTFQVNSISVHFPSDSSSIEADFPISIYYQAAAVPSPSLEQDVVKLNDQEQRLLSQLSQVVPPASAGGENQASASSVLGKSDPFK